MPELKYTINVESLKAKLAKVAQATKSPDMMQVSQSFMLSLIQDHIAQLGQTRHNTANRLGATPTRHYNADAVLPGVVDSTSASIEVNITGIQRAYQDLTITPINGKYLTIPVSAISYGYKVSELQAQGYKIFRPKGKKVLGYSVKEQGKKSTFVALYALSEGVFQAQDSSLMPPNDDIEAAFVHGAEEYLKAITPKG